MIVCHLLQQPSGPEIFVITDRFIFRSTRTRIGVRKLAVDWSPRLLGNCLGLLVWGLRCPGFLRGGRFTCAMLSSGLPGSEQKLLRKSDFSRAGQGEMKKRSETWGR
jgi:hypothetical protein